MNLFNKLYEELNEEFTTLRTTDGPRKRSVERDIYSMVNEIGSEFEYGITLVGHPYGSDPDDKKNSYANIRRHINDFRKIGIISDNLFVIEKNEEIYNELKHSKDEKHLRCKIRLGDFYDNLKNLLQKGYKFKFVDFDGTEEYSSYETKLIDLYSENINNIGCLRILASVRGIRKDSKELYSNIAKNSEMENFYRSVYMNNLILKKMLSCSKISDEEKNRLYIHRDSNTIIRKAAPPADDILYNYVINKGLNCFSFTYNSDLDSKMTNFLISKKDLSHTENYGYNFEKNIKTITISGKTIKVLLPPESDMKTTYYLINGKIYRKKRGVEEFICFA